MAVYFFGWFVCVRWLMARFAISYLYIYLVFVACNDLLLTIDDIRILFWARTLVLIAFYWFIYLWMVSVKTPKWRAIASIGLSLQSVNIDEARVFVRGFSHFGIFFSVLSIETVPVRWEQKKMNRQSHCTEPQTPHSYTKNNTCAKYVITTNDNWQFGNFFVELHFRSAVRAYKIL